MTLEITYCCDCEWFVTDGEHGSRERTSLAIDHASATGHETDTLRIESSTSTSTTSSAASAASRAIGIGLSRPEQGHYGVDHRDVRSSSIRALGTSSNTWPSATSAAGTVNSTATLTGNAPARSEKRAATVAPPDPVAVGSYGHTMTSPRCKR